MDDEDEDINEVSDETLQESVAFLQGEGESSSSSMIKPSFPEISAIQKSGGQLERRKIPVPPHRLTPLKNHWMEIYKPIVEHLKLQIRMNQKSKSVEIRTSKHTTDSGAIQKAEDFLKAFMLGFSVEDAVALLRLDDLYVDSFDVTDVKRLSGANLSRAIGRISGKDGKTKFAIENATRTRIVIADTRVHILGSFMNMKVARDAICDLILGSPASKVYNRLRQTSARSVEKF